MKAMKIVWAIVLICFFTMSNVAAQTDKTMTKAPSLKAAKMEMKNTYLVIAPHTPEQCMKMMNEMKSKGTAYLSKFKFGCMAGDHTAYAFLTASSEDAVRKMLPEDLQTSAKIQKVEALSPVQIEKMHKGM